MTWTLMPARTQAHIHGKIGEESFVVSVPFKSREDRIVARMMAAAPKMLEALENIENDDKHMPETAWKLVCEAIAAAKGWT